MVTAPILMKETLGIQLPKAANSEKKDTPSFGIAITAQGQILLNGKITDETGLTNTVKEALQKDKNLQILIGADGSSRHSDLVRVIDLVKGIGVNRFALQVQRQNQ